MSKFSKALEIIGIGAKDQKESYSEDYFEDDFEDEQPQKTVASERSRRYPKRDVIDDSYDEDVRPAPQPTVSNDAYAVRQNKTRLSAIRGGVSAIPKTMVIHTPKSYQESQNLVMQLKQNKQIIIKLDSVEKEVAQRILDFMSGAVFALECQVVKISKAIYLFASSDMLVEQEEAEPDLETTETDSFYSVDEMRRK